MIARALGTASRRRGPGRRRAHRRRPGDARHVARGRPARDRADAAADRGRPASTAIRTLNAVLPPPPRSPASSAACSTRPGCRRCSSASSRCPRPPVEPPSDATARAIAELAEASTVRVSAATCGFESSGSGVVVADDYVVTNAHVVAGAGDARIRVTGVAGQVRRARRPVRSGPGRRAAHTPRPARRPAAVRRVRPEPWHGRCGARLPGRWRLTVVPAAVDRPYPATGRDIYGQDTVRRQILELRAADRSGRQRRPVRAQDGTIGGLVFAEARTDPDVGYALSPTAVAAGSLRGSDTPRRRTTGECLH